MEESNLIANYNIRSFTMYVNYNFDLLQRDLLDMAGVTLDIPVETRRNMTYKRFNPLKYAIAYCQSEIKDEIERRCLYLLCEGRDEMVGRFFDVGELEDCDMTGFGYEFVLKIEWFLYVLDETYNSFRITGKTFLDVVGEKGIEYMLNAYEPLHTFDGRYVLPKIIEVCEIDIKPEDIPRVPWREDWFKESEKEQDELFLDYWETAHDEYGLY